MWHNVWGRRQECKQIRKEKHSLQHLSCMINKDIKLVQGIHNLPGNFCANIRGLALTGKSETTIPEGKG
jgi:hypothetical protein